VAVATDKASALFPDAQAATRELAADWALGCGAAGRVEVVGAVDGAVDGEAVSVEVVLAFVPEVAVAQPAEAQPSAATTSDTAHRGDQAELASLLVRGMVVL